MQKLAQVALAQYDLPVQRCQLASDSTNLIYRVEAEDGAHYALRLATPGWRMLNDLQAEAMWLEALARDTDICVPRLIRARDGQAVITAQMAGVPAARYATLTTWLPGEPLGQHLDESHLAKMGELFARMHLHGASWQPPAEFKAGTFDRMFARGEPDVLLEVARQDAPQHIGTFQRARACVDAAYAAIDPADLRVIHCDLWHDNIKVHDGQLCPFDFEDTIRGYRLHDIAMAMLDLLEEVGAERYDLLLAAFKRGYTVRLPWPEGDMVALQIGRYLWKLNYVARFEREHLVRFADYCAAVFEQTTAQGKFVLPPRS